MRAFIADPFDGRSVGGRRSLWRGAPMKRRLRRLRRIVLGGLILGVSTSLVRVLGWTASGERRL